MNKLELEKQYSQINEIPTDGFYSEIEYLWLIEKQEKWNVDDERGYPHFGNAGYDGIEFGLRKGGKGIWAFYPIDNEYEEKAETVSALVNLDNRKNFCLN